MWSQQTTPRILFALFLSLVLLPRVNQVLTDKRHTGDAPANLCYSLSLASKGIYSKNYTAVREGTPSSVLDQIRREPLPPFFTAMYMRYVLGMKGPFDLEQMVSGHESKHIKQVHILFIFTGLFLVSYLTQVWGGGFIGAILAALISFNGFFCYGTYINRLYTELHAGVLILFACWFFVRALQKPGWLNGLLLGVSLGALALTKACFYYLNLPLLFSLPVLFWICHPRYEKAKALGTCLGCGLVGMALVMGPWMARNYKLCGTTSIAAGGGQVLSTRAAYLNVTHEEFLGSFYCYGPVVLRDAIGSILGFNAADLEPDGKLNRLVDRGENMNRENSLRHSGVMTARQIVKDEEAAEGIDDPIDGMELSQLTQNYALEQIKTHFGLYLKTTPVFVWRSLWLYRGQSTGGGKSYLEVALSLLILASFAAAMILGLLKKDRLLLGLAYLPLVFYSFYLLFSHCLPRYLAPMVPVGTILLVLFATRLCGRIFRNGKPTCTSH